MKRILLMGMLFIGITTLAFAEERQALKLPKLGGMLNLVETL